jgi:hypothetical protein
MTVFTRILFQGTLLGCALVILIARWIANPITDQPTINQNTHPSKSNPHAGISLSPLYPQSIQQWRNPIERCCIQYQLDPDLVGAVMLQESGGNADAYSHNGAIGLMQIMPRDGLASSFFCDHGPCFANRPTSRQLYDPQFNIDFGCRMLRGLIDQQPTLRDALKAYGPKDVGYAYADLVISIYERYADL